ncbi:putative ribosome biogenesis protein Pescadillo [Piedraia hortae CBS 480.64]|uniref:Pescadillo homolog n=1 Tax=Piedraia hortae CBS 480.64 TaxID=1314780 RepID=A0A6A7BSQ7_9PEZI|nr:putative ribosome biogenesis protein Pescadillo [Piedraia hortae CBS 480.64]
MPSTKKGSKKEQKKGAARNYITRSQAVRKLQLSLPDFRRLCIFKGIYPREPRSRRRVSKSSTPSTTYYYTKDIQYLLHEPLLNKFRAQKTLAKKVANALGRNEVGDAVRLERNHRPRIRLDHIIRERYPTFVDALRDLDDALSMLFLFANLPSSEQVPPKTVAKCQRLTLEFEHYLIQTHSLRKSFLSIKGIYYQATIQGQDILWLVPYRFVQRASADVDFRIMATFVEFYTQLLGFVNYRLYTSIGLVYPPKFDQKREDQGAELGAYRLEGNDDVEMADEAPQTDANRIAQEEADKLIEIKEPEDVNKEEQSKEEDGQVYDTLLDRFQKVDAEADDVPQPVSSDAAGRLFQPFVFFLSRETPRHPLEFLLKAFGCKRVGWDSSLGEPGAFCSEDDERVTHQVVDRPPTDNDRRVPGRIYVQPQWVWDSINFGELQPADQYAPGASMPAHLSPWIKPKKGEYDPTISLAEQETAREIEAYDEDGDSVGSGFEDSVEDEASPENGEAKSASGSDMNVSLGGGEADASLSAASSEFEGFSSSDEEAPEIDPHQAELEAEAQGLHIPTQSEASLKKSAREAAKKRRLHAEREEAETRKKQKMLLPRSKQKLYERASHSRDKREAQAAQMRAKRRKLESTKK